MIAPFAKKTRTRIYAIIFGCVLLIFTAIATEVICRSFFVLPSIISEVHPLGLGVAGSSLRVRQKEYDITYKMNMFGFRSSDFLESGRNKETRVLFLGDSFTEGLGVSESERFSNQTCAALNGKSELNTHFACLNAGQIATNPPQYFLNLINFGVALKPDVVFISIFLGNDFMGGRTQTVPETYSISNSLPKNHRGEWSLTGVLSLRYARHLVHHIAASVPWLRRLTAKAPRLEPLFWRPWGSSLWDIFFGTHISLDGLKRLSGLSEADFDKYALAIHPEVRADTAAGLLNPSYFIDAIHYQKQLSENPKLLKETYYSDLDFRNVVAFIDEMSLILKKRDISHAFVIIPDIFDVSPQLYRNLLVERYGYSDLPHRLLEVEPLGRRLAKHLGGKHISYIDITDRLKQTDTLPYFLLDGHLNAHGHSIVSNALATFLRQPKLERLPSTR